MARYQIFALCVGCGGIHKFPIIVTLEDGPAELQTIADVYREKVLPAALRDLNCTPLACWETGRSFTQENNEQIILVPSQEVSFPK
jgi:hypothetical protein